MAECYVLVTSSQQGNHVIGLFNTLEHAKIAMKRDIVDVVECYSPEELKYANLTVFSPDLPLTGEEITCENIENLDWREIQWAEFYDEFYARFSYYWEIHKTALPQEGI